MTPGDRKSVKIERKGEQKWSQGRQQWAKGHQKWAKRKPKGTKRQPRGAKREPKVSQGTTKMRQRTTKMYQKIDLRKMSPKVLIPKYFLDYFGSHFPSKIDEESMRKLNKQNSWAFMKKRWGNETKIQSFSRNVFIRKTSFSIKVNVRKPHVLSSRMRVAEDSPKKRKSEKLEKTL